MEAQNNAIVKSFNDKLIYIEPNFISGGRGNVPVPLEDLCVYAELRVECNLTKSHKYNDGDFVLQMRVENDTPHISLYNGVKYSDKSTDTFLSTEGYDNYTLSGMKEQGVEELFGVESIEISYNSFVVPEVVIKFTDIKGAALHGAEELAHNSDGSFNANNMSLCSRFLSCFFTVPYPRFTLLVKGFYGKPVYYDLTCADFRSSFNAKSGNYDVTVRLVGYSFALISDVNVCSLLAAPYSQYKGKEYWKEQTQSGGDFFIDGVPMPTLAEIVSTYNEKYASLQPLGGDEIQTTQQVKNSFDDYIALNTSLTDLMINLSKIKKDDKKLFIVDFENNKIFLTETNFSCFENNDVKDIVNVYVNQVNRIDTKTPFKTKDFFNNNSWYKKSISKTFDLSEIDVSDEVKEELIAIKSNLEILKDGVLSAYNIYYYDLNNEFEYLERQQKRLESEIVQNTNVYEEMVIEQMKTMLGFYPTIGNITKILFAHLETFLYMFEEVKKFNRNSFDGLFPKILEKNVEKNGVTTYVETWLGKRFSENDRAEVGFVHGLYNGIKNVLQSEYFIKGNGSEDDVIYAYHGDLFKEHPFVNGFKNGYNEDVFVKRFFQIAESANYIAHDNINKEIAINDARCFHIFNPTGYPKIGDDLLVEKFLEPISKVESGAYSTIYNKRFSKKIRFYDIQDALLYNKKIITSDKDKKAGYTTLNVDGGWSSLNFKYDFYFKHCTAMLARISKNPKKVENCKHSVLEFNKNSKQNVVLSYNEISREYSDAEVAKINSPSDIAKKVPIYNHYYYKLSNTMTNNNMTFLTIPSFYLGLGSLIHDNEITLIADNYHSGVLYGRFLFVEEFYKKANIYSKAAMFLETFNWNNKIQFIIENILCCGSDTVKNVSQLVEAVPYFMILTIGAAMYSFYTEHLYIMNKKYKYLKTTSSETYENVEIDLKRRFTWDNQEVKKMFDMIPQESRDILQNEFKKWVNSTYKKWDNVFKEEEEKLAKDKNYNSPLYYVTVFSQASKATDMDKDKGVFYRLFRETHPIVQEMTKQFFELKWLVKDNMNYIAKEDFYRKKFRVYAEAFNEEIGKIFSNVKENIRSQYFKNMTSPRDYIDLNLYRYLKQLWDRWIISGNGYNDWKMVDVFRGENKRIHFIDPIYNDVTNLIMVDIGKFVELIQSCKEHEDMPFLSFLSYYFRDNNCVLHNVQNFINGQDKGNLSQIFDTVPAYGFNPNDVKKFSDLIVMFSFQGAESQEDSFNLNDVNNLPPSFNNHFGEYIIPSFGVAYGMQNQNYFTDVDVSMTTPNITDQVLQATFQIADENSGNASTENGAKIRSIGQDMYRVYSNHAYQCSVTMMGCAWVQPLMYFQLTNVPIFCGAYIIHKVTHSITPNNMVTKFVGTKVSKISMRRLENSYYYIQREISQREHNIYPKILASVTNNCNYAHFPPYSSDDSTDSKDLAILLGHFNGIWYSNLTYGIYYAIMLRKTKHSIEKNNLIFGLDVFLYNMWVAKKASLTSETLFDFFNNLFIANPLIFDNPTKYEGKEEELVSYYEENIDNINQILSGLTKCFSDIQDFVDKTANDSTIGFEQIDGCAILTSDLRQENIVYCVGDGNIGDVVFLKCQRDGQQHFYWGAMYNVTNEEVTIDNLIASFNKSMNESKTLKGVVLNISKNNEKEQKYVSNKTVRALLTVDSSASDEIKGQIFDMILQTYSQYLNHICWVVKDANSSHLIWDSIMIEMKTNNQFNVDIGYVRNINTIETSVVDSYDSLNVQFYMSIIKKYSIIKSGSKYSSLFDSFKNECGNFNKLNSKEKWKDEVLNFFSTNDNTKNIKIKDCDDLIDEELSKVMVTSNGGMPNISTSTQIGENFVLDIPSTQSFEGTGYMGELLNKNQLDKVTNSTAVASISEEEMENLFLRYGYTAMDSKTVDFGESLAQYAYENATGRGGQCAKYVRMALEGALTANTYNFSTNGRPESACRYWQFLNYWGFTCIYHGMPSQYSNTYQDGDIIVSAGLINGPRGNKDKHGHIQIYYDKKWYCDKKYNNANVYSNSDRSCFIFRIANTSSNDSSTSISNANYKASESIINAIQYFEGFMPVWYLDSDSYSIGYGFKMTLDLSSKYPRTSENTCTAANRCGLIGKEKPNTKGCMTKQEANDYMRKTTLPTLENEFRNIMKDLPSYNQYQLDALFCLMYNIGPSGLKDDSPKLMQALKEQNLNDIVKEMNHGGSSHVKRRQWEQQLFREHKYPPYP